MWMVDKSRSLVSRSSCSLSFSSCLSYPKFSSKTTWMDWGIYQVREVQKYEGSLPFIFLAWKQPQPPLGSTLLIYKKFISQPLRFYLQNTFRIYYLLCTYLISSHHNLCTGLLQKLLFLLLLGRQNNSLEENRVWASIAHHLPVDSLHTWNNVLTHYDGPSHDLPWLPLQCHYYSSLCSSLTGLFAVA